MLNPEAQNAHFMRTYIYFSLDVIAVTSLSEPGENVALNFLCKADNLIFRLVWTKQPSVKVTLPK